MSAAENMGSHPATVGLSLIRYRYTLGNHSYDLGRQGCLPRKTLRRAEQLYGVIHVRVIGPPFSRISSLFNA